MHFLDQLIDPSLPLKAQITTLGTGALVGYAGLMILLRLTLLRLKLGLLGFVFKTIVLGVLSYFAYYFYQKAVGLS